MAEDGATLAKRPNWVEIATLVIASCSFLGSISLAVLGYRLDAQTKGIQARLDVANARIAEFQVTGAIEYSYSVVDIKNFCGSTSKLEDFQANHMNTMNLYDGFIQNEVWLQAKGIVENACRWVDLPPEGLSPEDQKAHDKDAPTLNNRLAYIQISSVGKTFNPRAKLEVKKVPSASAAKIWEFSDKDGAREVIPLGSLDKIVLMPVAILLNETPHTAAVIVPTRVTWLSPMLQNELEMPLTFIFEGKHWKSIQFGWSRSGA
jgi:hypothetical protein